MERRDTRIIKKRSLSFIACYTFHNLSQPVALFDIGGIAERAAAGLIMRDGGFAAFRNKNRALRMLQFVTGQMKLDPYYCDF